MTVEQIERKIMIEFVALIYREYICNKIKFVEIF